VTRSRSRPISPGRPRLRKSLGQHHLTRGDLCRPLVEFLRLEPGAAVIEIGPGGGVLTRELLAAGARVLAVELDRAWAFELARRGPGGGLGLVVADALELDWARLPGGTRVAGNLPYNVGTPIVERIVRTGPDGTRCAFLLQAEVVDRMVARPGDASYGALSLRVELRARARRLGRVPAGAFSPPPKVESAFVGLEVDRSGRDEALLGRLDELVGAAFGQRRKTLRNALGARFGRERAEAALARAGIEPSTRAERLGLAEFARLEEALA